MDDTDSKFYLPAFFISICILIFWIIAFFLSTLKYCLYIYKIKFEENDPYIDLSGIQSFSFVNSTPYNVEYNPYVPNLGYTGDLVFDCYKGICNYYSEAQCGTEEGCYSSFYQHSSSTTCRNTEGKYCNNCTMENYMYYSCSCTHIKDSNEYSQAYNCYADNIIYNWKNLYYNRKNQTNSKFNYFNNSVPANSKCPSNMHQCGILDEFGNKLCYPTSSKCPINYVTLNKTEKNYNYKEYTIDGVTIYYTDEAIEDGKVLGGFYVDSDLKINYKIGECQIITTGKISELLNSHKNKLYRNSLDFDPYQDKDIDKKGKAYLKWCIPGVGKERNINLIKQLMEDYELNKTTNKNFTHYKKGIYITYFMALPGYVVTTISFIITTILIRRRNLYGCRGINYPFTIFFNALVFFSSFSCLVTHSELSAINKSNFYKDTFNLIIRLNKIGSWMNITLVIIIVIFFCYLCYLNEKPIFKGGNQYKNLEDKKTTELQNKNNFSDFSAYDNYNQSSNTNKYPLTPEDRN